MENDTRKLSDIISDDKLCLSVKEVAKILGRSEYYVRALVREQIIPGKCIMRKGHRGSYFIYKNEFLKMIGCC